MKHLIYHMLPTFIMCFFSLLIKSRKKYIDIIGPKDRWTNRIFSKIKQILGIKTYIVLRDKEILNF